MPRGGVKVPYKVPNSEFYQWVGVYERMARERILFLRSGLDDNVVNGMIATLLYLENEDRSSPVQLYVNVPGSLTKAGLALFDTMRSIAFPIATLNLGMAADMGAFVVAAGDKGKRSSLPNARFVLCAPAIRGVPGEQPPIMQAEDIGREVGEVLRDRRRLAGALAELTGQTEDAVLKVLKRDAYFDAKEAKAFGLIDNIVAPKTGAKTAASDDDVRARARALSRARRRAPSLPCAHATRSLGTRAPRPAAQFGFGNFGANPPDAAAMGAGGARAGDGGGDSDYTPQLA